MANKQAFTLDSELAQHIREFETLGETFTVADTLSLLRRVRARLKELEAKPELVAIRVLHTAVRGDEHRSWWPVREWLDKQGIYNGDLSNNRLTELVCKTVLDSVS